MTALIYNGGILYTNLTNSITIGRQYQCYISRNFIFMYNIVWNVRRLCRIYYIVIRNSIKLFPIFVLFHTLLLESAWSKTNPEAGAAKVIRISQIEEGKIKLDGYLNEDSWIKSEFGNDFTQKEPIDGDPATEQTEVRVLYSNEALYIGIKAYDSDPENIQAELVRRDYQSQADEIAVLLDTYHDRRTAFEFAVNPRGSIRDVYYYNDNFENSDSSWDPVWQVKTKIHSDGWTAEFRIPLNQLRFNNENSTWGLQVYRRIQRKAEEVYWAPYSKESSGFVSLFGTLTGFKGLPKPLHLEVRPYAVINNQQRHSSSGNLYNPRQQTLFSGGLDLKYGITSDFILDLSINPDFGQVEADPSEINLSAYETYFPEKRLFFIEGSGLFSGRSPVGSIFYSRRIGRRPQGWATPPPGGTVEIPESTTILAAGKLTGKSASGLGVGILSAFTAKEKAVLRDSSRTIIDREIVEPLTHYFVTRIEKDFKEGSHTIGAMVTAVNRKLPDNKLDFLHNAAYLAAIDGVHRWKENTYAVRWNFIGSYLSGSRIALSNTQQSPQHYFQRPDASYATFDPTRTSLTGYSSSLRVSKEGGTLQYFGYVDLASPGFNANELGFQSVISGLINLSGSIKYLRIKPFGIIRDFYIQLDFARNWTFDRINVNTRFSPIMFAANFKNNWSVTITPMAFGSNFYIITKLRGGPAINRDSWKNTWINLSSDDRKMVSIDFEVWKGGYPTPSGGWHGIWSNLNIRPNTVINISLGLESWKDGDSMQWVTKIFAFDSARYILAELTLKTMGLTTRVNWTISPKLSVEFYGQPYISSGLYKNFKEVTQPLAHDYYDRFRFYDDEISLSNNGIYNVDLNNDGTTDFTFGNPNFSFKELRSTFVIRWEYRPGSVIFFAWQHGRQNYQNKYIFNGINDIGDLFSLESDNTFLIKFDFMLGL